MQITDNNGLGKIVTKIKMASKEIDLVPRLLVLSPVAIALFFKALVSASTSF